MPHQDRFLTSAIRRLAALIDDQERLLEVIRKEQTELVWVSTTTPAQPSTHQIQP
jgi:hypothetical protein